MEMIKAAGLKKYYVTDNYEVHALDGVSLLVEEGEFLAVIGTSGSGKTTLLQILGVRIGTFIDDDDQKSLSMNDVSIVTNPISNLNLGCGIADITSYLKNEYEQENHTP